MKNKKNFYKGISFLAAFVLWTFAVLVFDVEPAGPLGTEIGFSAINLWFHKLTGVHMDLYVLTDWLGLVPVFVCLFFGAAGFIQLIKRKSLLKVDYDIIILGIYYIAVAAAYLFFEEIPVNYRPVLINGAPEASYPSSTTLLVLSVMPTLAEQSNRRLKKSAAKKAISVFSALFSAFMVMGRAFSGVHWLSDIIGAILLSTGLYTVYKSMISED